MTKLIITEDSALLVTKPTAAALSLSSQLEGRRRWLKDGGGLKVEPTEHNIAVLRQLADEVQDKRRPVAPSGPAVDWGRVEYHPKTSALPHQTRALAKVSPLPFFALFMEQGTGKTWVILARAGELYANGDISGMIVVTKKGVHRQWIDSEFPKHFSEKFSGHYSPFKAMPKFDGGLEVMSFNYDGVKTPKQLAIAMEFAQKHSGRLLIVLDESQEVKNPNSARHKAVENLKQFSSHRALATGTPIAKDLTDEWAQLRWLNEKILGIKYLTTFRARYCIMGGFEMRSVVGSKNTDDFKALTEPHTFRATKEELGILPKQYSEWVFKLNKSQIDAMRELKTELELAISEGVVIDIASGAQYVSKAQQIASGFIIDSETQVVHRLMETKDNPRAQALIEWAEAGDGKFIVWHKFTEDRKIIQEALEAAGISFVTYIGSDAERAAAVDSFMDPEGAQAFISNPQSGGTGLNLQGLCNRAVYYSNDWRAIDRWQSEDRIHRLGTVGVCVYTDLIAKHSPDRKIMTNLRNKKSISDFILDDITQIFDEEE